MYFRYFQLPSYFHSRELRIVEVNCCFVSLPHCRMCFKGNASVVENVANMISITGSVGVDNIADEIHAKTKTQIYSNCSELRKKPRI